MATITTSTAAVPTERKRAIDFTDGDVLIDNKGNVGLRTERHIIRVSSDHPGSFFVLDLSNSSDTFTLAPAGTYFTVSN
jgi:hypothetical protein